MLQRVPKVWPRIFPRWKVEARCVRCRNITPGRTLWTTATSSSSSLEDAVRSCITALENRHTAKPASLSTNISETGPPAQTKPPALCIVLATTHYPKHHLESLGEVVSRVLGPRALIGAVVDLVGRKGELNGPGLNITVMEDDEAAQVVTYRTDEDSVRHVKQKSVGRWPDLMRSRGSAVDDGENGAEGFDWKRFTTVSMGGGNVPLPDELEAVRHSEPPVFLTFSDREPHQFLQTLDRTFPKAVKVGLIGAMTPFATGRPHTLYYNDKVYSGGVIGAALLSKSLQPIASTGYTDLEDIGEPTVITNARGNIILALDGTNAAKELLGFMKDREMNKHVSAEKQLYVRVEDGKGSTVCRVTGGDPTKGTLALDTVKDLESGMVVRFLHYVGGKVKPFTAGTGVQDTDLQFRCTNADRAESTAVTSPAAIPNAAATLGTSIYAGTDGGFVLGRPASAGRAADAGPLNAVQGSLVCDVPGSELHLCIDQRTT
ncbi:uncharacterized protein EV422DRAFT_522670 [Fimicolochytrium jonesii]|uniref:uncharacterized protein n=1 Tax=Fimicolochytrium jonesii TaxID=1396493 RepID=UPI0022FEFCB0|nr:uncharacterized protein EV422DRAFT_522670 [Fimicolochytrium jonesii]KAI8822922.1 hypothetical protein EV422DRAFT_522670 [Fimicolochytrium jonesii]